MKRLPQSQAARIGTVGIVMTIAICLVSLQFDKVPMLASPAEQYAALFDDASGLQTGDDVTAAGVRVGTVTAITVDSGHARVAFTADPHIALGDTTTAAIKTTSLLGKRSVDIAPAGVGRLRPHSTIPLARTRSGYTLPNILNEATDTIRDIDLDQLTRSLDSASDVLSTAAPQVRPALDGIKRLSQSLNERDQALRGLLSGAEKVTSALAARAPQVNTLLLDGNTLLGELQVRNQALGGLVTGINQLSQQLSGMVHDNDNELTPALNKLGQVLAVVLKDRDNVSKAVQGLSTYIGTLGDAVASGPYFYAFIQNLVPAQYSQPLFNTLFGLPPAPLPIPSIAPFTPAPPKTK